MLVEMLGAFDIAPAAASCDSAAPASYDDIRYVRVSQYSLVGMLHPSFTFEAIAYAHGSAGASLTAKRAVPLIGTFTALDAAATMARIVDTLRQDRFFELRFHQAKAIYLDGPEDEIAVARCGQLITLGTLPYGVAVDLDDSQAQAFYRLEADLRDAIFTEKNQWVTSP